MTHTAMPTPDTSEMLAVHQVFRKALAAAPQLVGEVRAGDSDRVHLIAGFYGDVLALLDVHHEAEDLLIWPKLLERSPHSSELVTAAAHQHEEMQQALARAKAALTAWRETPEAGSATDLTTALSELSDKLVPHLDDEEMTILPLCAAHLTPPEWGELPAYSMKHFAGERLWLFLGLVRENMPQAQRANMVARMPAPVLAMWTSMGEDAFNAFIADVRQVP